MAEITITNENFESEVMQSQMSVLVDFWASWCGPCKMLAPTVAQIADEYEGRVKVGKVNVDEQPDLAGRYGIASIPTLMLFENGQVKNTSVGFMPKEQIEEMLV